MQILAAFAALTVFAGLSTAKAIDVRSPAGDLHTRATPGFQDLVNSASSLFAWEAVGLSNSIEKLRWICDNFDTKYANKYAPVGYNIGLMKYIICIYAAEPSLPSFDVVRHQMDTHTTDMFITQLLNAFPSTPVNTPAGTLAPLAYLCQSALSRGKLEQFSIQSDRVMSAVCGAAGLPTRESDFGAVSRNDTAIADYKCCQAEFFATELITGAETSMDCSELCNASADFLPRMKALGMDGENVRLYLCWNFLPFTVQEALTKVIEAVSDVFVSLILFVDHDVLDWNQWLCQNLNVEGMNKVGLNGTSVLHWTCPGQTVPKTYGKNP